MYLSQSLHRMLQQSPDMPLTIYGDRKRTVAQSYERISRLAAALQELGVRQDDRVAYLGLNSDRFHEYCFAVPWADAILNPINIRWSPSEIAYGIVDSDTHVIFVDDTYFPYVETIRASGAKVPIVIYCGEGPCPPDAIDYEDLISSSPPVADARRGGQAPFGIFYTGGTTGTPKGVVLSHTNVISSALGLLAGQFLGPGARMLHALPLFHLGALGMWVTVNVAGATHVIIPSFTPDGAVDAIVKHRVTDALLVPTMIQMLLDDAELGDFDRTDIRRITIGAAPTSDALFDRARVAFPAAYLSQAYGMTEAAPAVTFLNAASAGDPVRQRSAGRALPHVEIRVVDAEGGDVPRGHVGEVVVRGDNVMLGYWNRPEETAAVLRDGWLHTGDLAHMDDEGYLFIVDRLKDMIITGGENVYPAEVENALASHAAVAMVAVIGVPDSRWGERVHAVVVLKLTGQATEVALRDHCRALIAGYKVPRSIEFVDELPLSGAGKVLKRDIKARHLSSAGQSDALSESRR